MGTTLRMSGLLVRACKSAGITGYLLLDLYRTLFHYALDYGFDWSEGGFYESGPLGAPADRRDKIWWVQAEGLLRCSADASPHRRRTLFKLFFANSPTGSSIIRRTGNTEIGTRR